MAKPWAEVADSDTFKSADPATQQVIRQQYFDSVVAPKVPADKLDTVRSQFFSLAAPEKAPDQIEGMSNFAKFMAGAGKGFDEMYTGFAQSPEEVKAARKQDAPLMATTAGYLGNIAGNIGGAVPAMLIPGVNTVIGATLLGGVFGALQPAESGEERATNVLTGAGTSGALTGAMRALPAVKNVLQDTFTEKGQGRMALNAIQRFAADPMSLLRADPTPLLPGSVPTLAEATGDRGIAQLQRAARLDPQTGAALDEANKVRQGVRLDALRDISGDDIKREFFVDARKQAAETLYDKAFAETPTVTPWIKGQITQLQTRPSFGVAVSKAQKRALEEGKKLDPDNVTQVLHYTKMSLDDMIGEAKRSGNDGMASAIMGTRDKLVSLLESKDFSPSYREARDTYAQMSKPINQMDVGTALYKKLQPALSDFGAERTTPGAFAQAVREGDQTARTATGFRGATMEGTMSPEQLNTINSIARDIGRYTKAEEAGAIKGSPTAQYLAGHEIMKHMMEPIMPSSWSQFLAGTILGDTVAGGAKWLGSSVGNPLENRVQAQLRNMLLDPDMAKVAYQAMLARQQRFAPINALAAKLLPPISVGAGSDAAQQ